MQTTETRRQVRQVLWLTLILNMTVAVTKITLGLLSGALAITADGFHSLIDGSSNVVALIAARIAARPPDDDHPYGHRRFETLAALMIGALLLLTAWELVGTALARLREPVAPVIAPLTIAVLFGTLLVNLFISTYQRRAGRRLRSELLLADAANTTADVFVTLSVLVSTSLIARTGWTWLDPAAALVIVVLIGRAAYGVLRRTGSVLVDTAPFTPAALTAIATSVPAVSEVLRARSRGPADAAHIDVDVQVAPATTAEHTAAIAAAIRAAMHDQLDGVAEVEVHFAPHPLADRTRQTTHTATAHAAALGLTVHELRLCDTAAGCVLDLHVEVPPGQTLARAHEQVTRLEGQLRASLPDIDEIITHIEPALHTDAPAQRTVDITARRICQTAEALLRRHFPGADWHHLRVARYDDGIALALHVTLPAHTSMTDAHSLAEAAETVLRANMPDLRRVTIHTEPPEEAA